MPRVRTKRFLRVKLDMVNKCQLRCIMCHFAHPDFVQSGAVMDRALLERVAREIFPIAHDVVLSSSAEPLLAPELPRALELCREHGVPFFHFSTNALSLTERILHKIVDARMPLLTISIDGATKATFERIRPSARWEALLDKFDLVRSVKESRGSDLPRLSATAVLMRSNIEEMPQLIRLMHAKGVGAINLVHMGVLGGMGMEEETLARYPALCNRILVECRDVARDLGVDLMAPLPFPPGFDVCGAAPDVPSAEEGGGTALLAPATETFSIADFLNHKNREFNLAVPPRRDHRRMCYFPWYYLHVNPDGTVFPCGHWYEFTTFGDFRSQSFREIWLGDQFVELRRQIRRLELRKVCANCAASGMGRPDVRASFSEREKQRRGA